MTLLIGLTGRLLGSFGVKIIGQELRAFLISNSLNIYDKRVCVIDTNQNVVSEETGHRSYIFRNE